MNTIVVNLQYGIKDRYSWQKKLELREVCGHDENIVYEKEEPRFLTIRKFLEQITINKQKTTVKNLSIGDKTLIILKIYENMFGQGISFNINCPKCKEMLSIDISAKDLEKLGVHNAKKTIVVDNYKIRIRPITIYDQEYIYNNRNIENLEEKIIRRCILECKPKLPQTQLPQKFLNTIANYLEKVDPLSEIILVAKCTSCSNKFNFEFELEEFFLEQIKNNKEIEKEIHQLAFNYHWERDTILNLSRKERKRYCELINQELIGGSSQ